jgi:hypothetical protein
MDRSMRIITLLSAAFSVWMAIVATFVTNHGIFEFSWTNFVKYNWTNLFVALQLAVLLLIPHPRIITIGCMILFFYVTNEFLDGMLANIAAHQNRYTRFGPFGRFLGLLNYGGALLVPLNFALLWVWLARRFYGYAMSLPENGQPQDADVRRGRRLG